MYSRILKSGKDAFGDGFVKRLVTCQQARSPLRITPRFCILRHDDTSEGARAHCSSYSILSKEIQGLREKIEGWEEEANHRTKSVNKLKENIEQSHRRIFLLDQEMKQFKSEFDRRISLLEERMERSKNLSRLSRFQDWIFQCQGIVAFLVGCKSLEELYDRLDTELLIKKNPMLLHKKLFSILSTYSLSISHWEAATKFRWVYNDPHHRRDNDIGTIVPSNVDKILFQDLQVLEELTAINQDEKDMIKSVMTFFQRILKTDPLFQ